jgi:hypothetical protein
MGLFAHHDYLSWFAYFDIIRIILGLFKHCPIYFPKASIHLSSQTYVLSHAAKVKITHLGRYIHGGKEMTHTHYCTNK